LIKIEDILPFFPDFTKIDDFKKEICSSLEDYNRHIEELKSEMEEATKSADMIRKDIKELSHKYGVVKANQLCEICNTQLLVRDFYLFPCQHVFHSQCLRKDMEKHLDNVQRAKVKEIDQRIIQTSQLSFEAPKKKVLFENSPNAQNAPPSLEKLKDELDDVIAAECIYCGNIMIKIVGEPFLDPVLDSLEIRSWAV